MKKAALSWQVGWSRAPWKQPEEWYDATVPGAAQLDYARAKGWEPFYRNANIRDYAWMEDVFWLYRSVLDFSLADHEQAHLVFHGIDYRYCIRMGGQVVCEGEGMFRTHSFEVSRYAGKKTELEVLIFPAPKADDSNTRAQARRSCKAAACYGWDWHPRLISAGIWDECYLRISHKQSATALDASYVLSEDLHRCDITVQVQTAMDSRLQVTLLDGETAAVQSMIESRQGGGRCVLTLQEPKLWHPVGWGGQHRYTLEVSALDSKGAVLDTVRRSVGLRRVKLVMNEGAWGVPGYPKSRACAPATVEVNGRRIFAKGSNWVNAKVFPGETDPAHYRSLIEKARDANMNILRIWGGGLVNKESFFDICDELGIMVWQEFPLACNEYPDEDAYLSVLEKEATAVVKRLRTHPCLVLWCGGNELFNSWSGMTEQHHALRLLDSICYREDRFTPFIMTSPLNGMAHGNYINVDEKTGQEQLEVLCSHRDTAYTEFGSSGASDRQTILSFMSLEDYEACSPENEVWREHFGFGAGNWEERWLCRNEISFYFGGWRNTDDLVKKSQFIQAMCYRSYFEEHRRQWPRCAMSLNWCFNEPWPTAANTNLLSYPDIPKPAYYAVQQALRPRMASLGIRRHLWQAGESLEAQVWLFNDAPGDWAAGEIAVSYRFADAPWIKWGTLTAPIIPEQTNRCCASLRLPVPQSFSGMVHIRLDTGDPGTSSAYTYLCRVKDSVNTAGMLNVDD